MSAADFIDCAADLVCLCIKVCCRHLDQLCNRSHLVFFKPTCCHSRRSDPDAACHKRTCRVIWHRVFIDCDINLVQTALQFFSGNRSEEHTSELQSRFDLVCRLLLEKKNDTKMLASTNECSGC